MTKVFAVFIASLLALFAFSAPVLAQENIRSGESTVLGKGEVINKDYFTSGKNVSVSGTVNGDAYVAGGTVVFDGTVNGDLLVAGGNVHIKGKVGDLRVAGGNVLIDGIVTGNVTAIGGDIVVEKDSQISGSLTAAGGSLSVDAPIGKGLTAATGSLVVSSAVGGDLNAAGGQLSINPGASVAGNLTYYSQNPAVISPEASVSGTVTHNIPPKNETKTTPSPIFNFGWIMFNFISSLIIGLIALFLAPNIIRQKGQTILEKPWKSLGMGLLTIILMPFVLLIIFITIIGIPIAIGLFIFYLILLFYINIFVSIAVGIKTFALLGKKANIYVMFLVGLIIYTVVTSIPVLGWLIGLIGVIIGLGAYILTDYSLYKSLLGKKLI